MSICLLVAFWKIRSTVSDLKFDYFFSDCKKLDFHHFRKFSNHRPKTRSKLGQTRSLFQKNVNVNFRSDNNLEGEGGFKAQKQVGHKTTSKKNLQKQAKKLRKAPSRLVGFEFSAPAQATIAPIPIT